MPDATINLIAELHTSTENIENLLATLRTLRSGSLEEASCLRYEVSQTQGKPEMFYIVERWKDQAALDQHFATEHFKAGSKQLGELCTSIQLHFLDGVSQEATLA